MYPSNILLEIFILLMVVILKIQGKRDFQIILDTIKCSGNPIYTYTPNCFVTKNSTKPLGHLEVKIKNELASMNFAFDVYFIRNGNEKYSILNSTDNDACTFFKGAIALNILSIARNIMLTYGNLPEKCPIPKDFNFLYENFYIDAEQFPPYVPEAGFSFSTNSTLGKDFIFHSEITGHVVHKSKNKWG